MNDTFAVTKQDPHIMLLELNTLITKTFGLLNFGQKMRYFGRFRTNISDNIFSNLFYLNVTNKNVNSEGEHNYDQCIQAERS